jgi:hypothetical protein
MNRENLASVFAWFITRPRSFRRWIARNGEDIGSVLGAFLGLASSTFWISLLFWALGVGGAAAVCMTAFYIWMALLVALIMAIAVSGFTAWKGDTYDADHRWGSIRQRMSYRFGEDRVVKAKVVGERRWWGKKTTAPRGPVVDARVAASA